MTTLMHAGKVTTPLRQLVRLQSQVHTNRQTLLWSATWPPAIQALAAELLTDPIKVVIAGAEDLKASHNIRQSFALLQDDGDKFGALEAIFERDFDGGRTLVFCSTKRGCDALTRQLRLSSWPALGIHGDKSQMERDWVLRART
jgi:ATP-dependent RNA helicase DDX5/DBP2